MGPESKGAAVSQVQSEDVDAQTVTTIGVFGIIVTVIIILGVQVLYYRAEKADRLAKYVEPGYIEAKTVQASQRNALSEYKWVDRQKEVVAIPIERAMDLVVRNLQTQKP